MEPQPPDPEVPPSTLPTSCCQPDLPACGSMNKQPESPSINAMQLGAGDLTSPSINAMHQPQLGAGDLTDEVFINGQDGVGDETEHGRDGNWLQPPDQVLPRKSSLIKDSARRNKRKKTVSFGSMPGERTVINGKFYFSKVLRYKR